MSAAVGRLTLLSFFSFFLYHFKYFQLIKWSFCLNESI